MRQGERRLLRKSLARRYGAAAYASGLLLVLPLEQRIDLFLAQVEASDVLQALLVVLDVVLGAFLVHDVRLALHLLQQLAQRLFVLLAA
ncbi:hypothetical protein GQ600_11867 [Phytophthora cactorum]|nr:hypothetical protein GQ600_11867 [Phytophthora cactorum]